MTFVLGTILIVLVALFAVHVWWSRQQILQLHEQREDDQANLNQALSGERRLRELLKTEIETKFRAEAHTRAGDLAVLHAEFSRSLTAEQDRQLALNREHDLTLEAFRVSFLARLEMFTPELSAVTADNQTLREEITRFVTEMTRIATQSRTDYEVLLAENEGIIRFLNEVPQNFGLELDQRMYRMILPDRLKLRLATP